jgi:trans-aconitate 2-methyltransferase
LAKHSRAIRVIGLDVSTTFIELVRANSDDRLSFVQHDITAVPFSRGPANLIFARFLLTHLSDPPAAVPRWATQLQRRGLLLLEETEAINTYHPVFARYLRIVEAMLGNRSNQLYAGDVLASLDSAGGLKSIFNERCSVSVRNRDAANMFVLNLRTWKKNEFNRINYSKDSISELDKALGEIGNHESSARDIEWNVRQAAWLKE